MVTLNPLSPSISDYQHQLATRVPLRQGGSRAPRPTVSEGYRPWITMITVTFNAEATLTKTIDSIIAQDYPNLEYLVIDGGSTDSTLEILQRYDSHITHWRSEPDQGLYDAMNKGISLSQGDIIGLLNAGDILAPESFQNIVQAYDMTQKAAVYTGDCQVFLSDHYSSIELGNPEKLPKRMIPHSSVFVDKKIYIEQGFFSLSYKAASDYDFLYRCYQVGVPFHYLPKTLTIAEPRGVSGNYYQAESEFFQIRWRYRVLPPWQTVRLTLISYLSISVHLTLKFFKVWHYIEEIRYASPR